MIALERLAEIRLTKSILLVPERILWKYLPPDEIEAGIGRGKAYKRGQRIRDFEERSVENERKFAKVY